MILQPKKYRCIKADVSKIKKLGYKINSKGSIDFDSFMNEKFPNFNLLSLLRTVEAQFTSTTKKRINREISYNNEDSFLKIEYVNEFGTFNDALMFIRHFTNNRGD